MEARRSRTAAEKIWDVHVVCDMGENAALLHVDRAFLHERVGGFVWDALKTKGRSVANPELVASTIDHIIDTDLDRTDKTKFPGGYEFINAMRKFARDQSLRLFDIGDSRQGISHVVAAEQAFGLPGATFVCTDSHTCTLGGLGMLAWGIGNSDMEHVLATQCIRRKRPKQMRVNLVGELGDDASAKDIILHLIATYGANAGDGYVIEFAGPAAASLPIEARMTICNMVVEFGAWTGLFPADDITFEFLRERSFAPKGDLWDRAEAEWRDLATDDGALFDREVTIDCSEIQPKVTWGTSPHQAVSVTGNVPDPSGNDDQSLLESTNKALEYMDLVAGMPVSSIQIEAAFIGSCTNARIADLRAAARILRGKRVAPGIKAICVPGSTQVKEQAEAEGLDAIFREAGFEWRQSGCSLCFFAGGDSFGSARRVISSTNRNFQGRQGPGVRTHLASPATVAASAITGHITDPRTIEVDTVQ